MARTAVLAASVGASFASSYLLTNIFPYVGLMVVHFSGATKEEAGYRAGVLASAFMFSRIPASVAWGYLADTIGRRPVLLIGCWTMFAFQLGFGLSPSFEFAVAMRLLMGLFSGVVGTSKTLAAELAGKSTEEQAHAMNIFSGANSLGLILGPAVSGVLYDPARQYPGTVLAQIPLVADYPFFLPNIVSALLSLFAGLSIMFFVPESLPSPQPLRSLLPCRSGLPYMPVDAHAADSSGTPTSVPFAAPQAGGLSAFLTKIVQVSRRTKVRRACNTYSFYSFISIAFSELFPLWLLAKSEVGGYGFDAQTIGLIISASAVLLLVFQALVFPYISGAWVPTVFAVRISIWSIAFYLQLPLMAYISIPGGTTAVIVVLVIQRGIQNILNLLLFTQANVMANNSCDIHDRGTVNGLVMGLGSLFKALGPLFAGSMFAWSVNNGETRPPFNFTLTFWLLSIQCIALAWYIRFNVPESLNSAHVSRRVSALVASTEAKGHGAASEDASPARINDPLAAASSDDEEIELVVSPGSG